MNIDLNTIAGIIAGVVGTLGTFWVKSKMASAEQKSADAEYLNTLFSASKQQVELLQAQVERLERRVQELEDALNVSDLRAHAAELMSAAAMRGSVSMGSMPMPGLVVSVDRSGRAREMVYFNSEYEELFGVSREDLYKDIDDVHRHVAFAGCDKLIERTAKCGRMNSEVVTFTVNDEEYRYVAAAWPVRINGTTSLVAILGIPLTDNGDHR